MSTESATAFIEKMKTDEEFARRVGEADSKEDRWALLKANGFDFTRDELHAHHNALDDGASLAT